jgi:hypothetical protein
MKLFSIFVAALLTTAPVLAANTYFPKDSVSDFEQTWYAKHLSAMEEPVLAPVPREKDYFAFRVLYLPTWGPPTAVRVERRGQVIRRRAVVLSGQGGYDPGHIKEDRRTVISTRDFESLLDELRKSGFWEANPKDDGIGFDGTQLIIEAVQGERHFTFVRWTPEHDTQKRGLTGIVAFYTSLFEMSGIWKKK